MVLDADVEWGPGVGLVVERREDVDGRRGGLTLGGMSWRGKDAGPS